MEKRDVIVQVSADRSRARFIAEAFGVIQAFSNDTGLPVTVATGNSVFPGEVTETMIRITIHGSENERDAIGLWRWLRATVNGIDCGRIELRRASWCAKSFANSLDRRDNVAIRYPNNDFPPTRVG
jgi:hypothetical protein